MVDENEFSAQSASGDSNVAADPNAGKSRRARRRARKAAAAAAAKTDFEGATADSGSPSTQSSSDSTLEGLTDPYLGSSSGYSYADVNNVSPEDVSSFYGWYSRPTSDGEPDDLQAVEELLSVETDYARLPHPDVFNAYPVEVQRQILDWAERDVKARRDDESRRKDELVRARVERDRRRQVYPTVIAVMAIICATITGIATQNALISVVFLLIALAVVIGRIASNLRPPQDGEPPKIS